MSIELRAAWPSHGAKQLLSLASEIRTEVVHLDTPLALSDLNPAKFFIRITMEATREFAECQETSGANSQKLTER